MNPGKALKRLRSEVKLSQLFPITHLNSPSVFESKDGFLGSVIALAGVPFITEEPGVLNALSRSLHQTILALDERFMCYVTIHRKKENADLSGTFSCPFARRIDEKYHARFKNRALYKNNLYLTVVLKGDRSNAQAKSFEWFKRLGDTGSSNAGKLRRLNNMQTLSNTIGQLQSALSAFHPSVLGQQDDALGVSELMQFLSLIPNAGETINFRAPAHCPAIAKSIPDVLKQTALYPEGHLGQYLCAKQVFFGEYLQFQGADANDIRFGAMLSLKKYGKASSSVVLDPLLSLDAEFISTHSFAPIFSDAALKNIERKRSKLFNAKDKGQSQINDLHYLEDAISSESTRIGFHHNTLMLIATSISDLERAINQTVKVYAHIGAVVVKESPSMGAEPAFFAQIPANFAYIARASLISAYNFVDFCALHNYQSGFRDGNHLGQAVTLLETPSKTPVWFNFHGKGSATDPANGHTLVFGSTGAGKTTLVSFMDAQMGRYHGKSFFLDRDQASKIYVLACANSCYTVINPKNQHGIRMNPLQLTDTSDNRSFVKTWMASLVKHEGEIDLPADISGQINDCVNYNFESLAKPYRRLQHLVKILPVNFKRWHELRRWLKADNTHSDGEFSWLFDNEDDALELGFDKVGFDITYLTDTLTPLISTPVYLYLLHRISQSLDGRLTSLYIDEAFAVFSEPFWIGALTKLIPTIRKANGHFVFMTQSPQTVTTSAISATLIDNVKTTLIFPNAKASHSIYTKSLKLSDAQYHSVLTTPLQSRLFLYKQEQEVIVCKLDLSALEDEVRVLSGNKASIALMDCIRKDVGNNPEDWLPIFLARSAS